MQPIRRRWRLLSIMVEVARAAGAPGEAVAAAVGRPGLAELYARHAPHARRLAYLLTGDQASAEDVVHDAFVKVSGRLLTLRSPDAFPAYLRRTVVNTVISGARSRRRESARIERHARLMQVDMDAPGEDGDRGGELWEALGRLPERQRSAVVLRYWLDLSDDGIADALGCRPGTVRSLLSRALDTMRGVIDA